MTKKQKLAVRAMMYAFEKYGVKRLVDAKYIVRKEDHDEGIDFCEAYNVCSEMVDQESEETEK